MELFKPLAPLPDNVGCSRIRNDYGHKVTVGFSLLREGLCKVGGRPSEGIGAFLVGPSFLAGLAFEGAGAA